MDKVEKTGKFVTNKDLFSQYCDGFDLIGVRPNQVVLIQVKTNKPATQKSYIDFASKYSGSNLLIHVATWYDNKGMVIQNYFSNGEVITEDLRT